MVVKTAIECYVVSDDIMSQSEIALSGEVGLWGGGRLFELINNWRYKRKNVLVEGLWLKVECTVKYVRVQINVRNVNWKQSNMGLYREDFNSLEFTALRFTVAGALRGTCEFFRRISMPDGWLITYGMKGSN
jgi:hypothetical protein